MYYLLIPLVDAVLFAVLRGGNLTLATAHICSFLGAMLLMLFVAPFHRSWFSPLSLSRKTAVIGLLVNVLWLRGAVLGYLIQQWRIPDIGAYPFGLLISVYGYLVTRRIMTGGYTWPAAALVMSGYFFLLRFFFLGLAELIPEEAYYWLYAQHPSPGNLDHPPLTGWLIWLSVSLFGNSEFAVRFPALLCWLLGARFLFLLSRELFDTETATVSVGLYSTLPFFTAIGFTVAPDSPLIAAWLAGLYYLHGAVLKERRLDWYGFGISVGVGMLSKYTIVLLGGSAFMLLLFYKPARKWFSHFEPYAAAVLALVLFLPVLYWNATHEWASFVFQGPRRFEMPSSFAAHIYLLDILVLITPSGLLGFAYCLPNLFRYSESSGLPAYRSQRLFVWSAVLVPFVTFLVYSLRHETKLNWSGPGFLALLPCLAHQVLYRVPEQIGAVLGLIRKSWAPVLIVSSLCLGGALHYMALGLPFVPYTEKSRRFVGWESLAQAVSQKVNSLKRDGSEVISVIGMDKHNIASELSFYLPQVDSSAFVPVLGRSLFGRDDLMFLYWNKTVAVRAGSTLVLVARSESDLDLAIVESHFESVGDIETIKTERNGRSVGTYYMRVGKGFGLSKDTEIATAANPQQSPEPAHE